MITAVIDDITYVVRYVMPRVTMAIKARPFTRRVAKDVVITERHIYSTRARSQYERYD